VAEPSSAVTDTHPLIFHAAGGQRLGPRARAMFAAAEARTAIIYVPIVVIWEVTLLARSVRVNLHRPVREFFADLFSSPSYQVHPMDAGQVFDAGELRALRDPFDALVCAAARDLELPLITRDSDVTNSRLVRAVW
jgi:PIN domain nuclease of toxin-antitoxin system